MNGRNKVSAFTMIECLIALLILNTILLSFGLFIRQSEKLNTFFQKDEQTEWLIFLAQFENELASSQRISIIENRLYYENEKTFVIEGYQQMIRKRGTAGGHQPMLTGVKHVQFKEEDRVILLHVEFMNGDNKYGIWTKQKT
ncbi:MULTISPECIES: competence type IV pilus minor pilin ComGF [Enterococcus]|uniref:Competence protein ComGF n=1 Tax=Enterococcus mundtii TaxID=53346 RepID=A0AAI8WDE8_ENTMU|nr:competence type IV pilus minor pilin ComGF [Enterococcus mundtii]MCA6773851.1 ComGF family competence protein [Enterococcus mundtii]MDY4307318.1 competence type IV pilus minor pilin ComGF [Enterococcus mundtii]PJK24659.1 competence protein ComGF [Enterococcus mundtii]UBM04931.1 ComGF family competence protein [Enterococcus mundtii]BAO08180.1 competence protein ComGF [Enterococcus mundtii QU 25]